MIDWLLNDIPFGTGVGYCNAYMTVIFGYFRGPYEKWWHDRLLCAIIFTRIGHSRDENKWESSGRLDSNGLDIEGLKATQRNE